MRRKKIRGLKRHFRRYAAMKQFSEPLDVEWLYKQHYVYSKLGLAPWVGATFASNPPVRFRQEAFLSLLLTHQQWQNTFTDFPEPVYSAVWLMDSRFRDSQVVVGIRERITRYENIFATVVTPTPPLPIEYRHLPGVAQLHWTAYFDEIALWPDDLPPNTPVNAYEAVTTEAGEEFYLLRTGGKIWVGQSPGTTAS
jgi:hypothetical protein